MATNLALDDNLIEEARQLGGQKTKKDVVTQALMEYVQRRKQLELLELFGTIEYDDDYDPKAQRAYVKPSVAAMMDADFDVTPLP